MKFDVFGGFPIERKKNRLGSFDNGFWQQVDKKHEDLSTACGCYVFAIKHGDNIVPWYVGKTERRTFQQECFHATKIVYYNDVLASRRGCPLLFLLPRLTNARNTFSQPTRAGYRDIDFLETLLIGMALEQNRDLLNVKKTALLREMLVPGIVNSRPARPKHAVQDLRRALGLVE